MSDAQAARDREAALVLFGYAGSLILLGAAWWKAVLIAAALAIVLSVGWAPKWIARGLLMLGAVAALVFLDALPPPREWPALFATLRAGA